jgi:tryptophan synthase alpha chain
MTDSKIERAIRETNEKGQVAIIPYLTVGFPTLADTVRLVHSLSNAGSTAIELGIPFSDPLADGPTIQRASMVGLKNGINLGTCLQVVTKLREDGVTTPLILMGYYNPFLAYGISSISEDAANAGVDGLIVPDLPVEESGPLREACLRQGLDLINLLTPTSNEERIIKGCAKSQGFIYCVSVNGVTGSRNQVDDSIADIVARIRKHTNLPIAVGFGISKREHIETIGRYAQAAIVGSIFIETIEKAPKNEIERVSIDLLTSLQGG